ncbi:MAG: hypothetical protein ABSF51_12710 [Verrucomicrobiota bacterium]|jgi:hypothetical protein
MSKNNSVTLAIVQALRSDRDASGLSHAVLYNMADKFAEEVRQWAVMDRFMDATASVPGDDKPAEKKYPRREELKPTPLPVPDPSKTETSQELKTSLPDYGKPKEFLQAIGETIRATEKLWTAISEENWQDADNHRATAFSFVEETRGAIESM